MWPAGDVFEDVEDQDVEVMPSPEERDVEDEGKDGAWQEEGAGFHDVCLFVRGCCIVLLQEVFRDEDAVSTCGMGAGLARCRVPR